MMKARTLHQNKLTTSYDKNGMDLINTNKHPFTILLNF